MCHLNFVIYQAWVKVRYCKLSPWMFHLYYRSYAFGAELPIA